MTDVELEGLTEGLARAFTRMRREMVGIGVAAQRVMSELTLSCTPHGEGLGWDEEIGWRCSRCGSESMDLEMMIEVPCDG